MMNTVVPHKLHLLINTFLKSYDDLKYDNNLTCTSKLNEILPVVVTCREFMLVINVLMNCVNIKLMLYKIIEILRYENYFFYE